MLLDGLSIYALRHELENVIINGIFDGIHQIGRYDILLVIRKPGETFQLVISANPQYSRIHLTEKEYDFPDKPSLFCMNLRKFLNRGRIVFVEQPDCERLISIGVIAYDQSGNEEVRVLVAEVMGRHSNIVLYRQKDKVILDCIVHVTDKMSSVRQISPGIVYEDPPKQDKLNPFGISKPYLVSLLSTGFGSTKAYNIFLKNIAGIGPQLAKEILAHAGYSPEISMDELQNLEDFAEQIAQSYSNIIDAFKTHQISPTVVRDQNTNQVTAVSTVYPRQYSNMSFEEFTLLSEVCDVYYGELVTYSLVKSKKDILYRVVKTLRDNNETVLRKLNENFTECEKADVYLKFANLLSANLYKIHRGDTLVELEDIFEESGKTVQIPLDVKLTPSQNMQHYFKLYSKSKRGLTTVKESMQNVEAELEYFDTLELSIENATSVEELYEIEQEMKEAGYIKQNKQPLRKTVSKLLEFKITDGFSVIVGKNNRQNDRIVTKLASPDDLWFHVKDFPGSHVLLRVNSGASVPENVLKQAAEIGAYYSKARDSENVAVDYTFVKHVSKPKNAKPGKVVYKNYKTLYVSPKPAPGIESSS